MEFEDILQSDVDDIIKSILHSNGLNDNYKRSLSQWVKSNIKPKYKLIDVSNHFFFSIQALNGMKQKYLNKKEKI